VDLGKPKTIRLDTFDPLDQSSTVAKKSNENLRADSDFGGFVSKRIRSRSSVRYNARRRPANVMRAPPTAHGVGLDRAFVYNIISTGATPKTIAQGAYDISIRSRKIPRHVIIQSKPGP